MKIFLVDIGNTSTLFALADLKTGKIIKEFRQPTGRSYSRIPDTQAHAAVIASVVPSANPAIKKAFAQKNIKSYFLGKDIRVPIKNLYRNPKEVGIDRLVNALAGYEKYKKELVIIDFGTATTFDVVSKKGEYLGGAIAPGIKISIEALSQRTALLPKIELTHPTGIIGKGTIDSIRSGCSYGAGGLCDRIVDEIAKARKAKPLVIATGGYAEYMRRYCRSIRKIEPNLTLQGILASYRKSSKI
jgi:type III pantothenate kinase